MFISKITIEDYRIYHGYNELQFAKDANKNVFLISGNNGFGKTTLLNSLLWCLYGKLMVDVDDKFRQEIFEAGGYKKYATSNLNKLASENGKQDYKVTLTLTDVLIPSLPCSELRIERRYEVQKTDDKVQIFIDGLENELTREVGPEIFINDFILPKEIAKFFFFDAEKIVALAEVKSIEDKRALSKAYSEVLGLKKYEDLKINLEEIRIRLRKEGPSSQDKRKLDELQKEISQFKSLTIEYDDQIKTLQDEKSAKKHVSEQYQEKLIREGNSMTVNELNELRKQKNKLREDGELIKTKLKDMLELAPFAIAGNIVQNIKIQVQKEEAQSLQQFDPSVYRRIKKVFVSKAERLNFSESTLHTLGQLLEESIENYLGAKLEEVDILHDYSNKEANEFNAIHSNLKFSYSRVFKDLVYAHKNNRNAFAKVNRRLADSETKEDDLLIKEIRQQKLLVDKRIEDIETRINELNQEKGGLIKEISNKGAILAQLSKKIKLSDLDLAKDETAERLIAELDTFINNLRTEKKKSLEDRIKEELNSLMHKKEFVGRVAVDIFADIIDIHLFDKKGKEIAKETLSKGEQQLYATALLKSLVDESHIEFPVFVDSPLQKFDKKHSKNIISEFYPRISEQVVIFPLLEKEMNEIEFHMLLPKISKAFLIDNRSEYQSQLLEVEPKQLFTQARDLYEHVH